MKALAQIGAWHNSLAWMPAVILVSPLLDYLLTLEVHTLRTFPRMEVPLICSTYSLLTYYYSKSAYHLVLTPYPLEVPRFCSGFLKNSKVIRLFVSVYIRV